MEAPLCGSAPPPPLWAGPFRAAAMHLRPLPVYPVALPWAYERSRLGGVPERLGRQGVKLRAGRATPAPEPGTLSTTFRLVVAARR